MTGDGDGAERFRAALVCGWAGWLLAYAYTLWKCPMWVCAIGGGKLLVAVAGPFSIATAVVGTLLGWTAMAVRQRKHRRRFDT